MKLKEIDKDIYNVDVWIDEGIVHRERKNAVQLRNWP